MLKIVLYNEKETQNDKGQGTRGNTLTLKENIEEE